MINLKRTLVLLLSLILAISFLMPAGAFAQETGSASDKTVVQTADKTTDETADKADSSTAGETVRVGWYESSFCNKDANGRRSGYAYEYQLKIAAHTGWKYEYVNGSWSDLLEMLVKGEIDLMSDISYTEERAELMLFPELPMGAEVYYLFASPKNKEITSDDYSSLNGKKIGVNKDSIQEGFFLAWEKQHDVHAKLERLTCTEEESLQMLENGKLDGYITPDAFGDSERLVPVCKIGSSDFFFAVNKKRPDLLSDLNKALSSIQDENPFYNHEMSNKYVVKSGVHAFLTSDEKTWLKDHGPIRVGYQDNYLAFCDMDDTTGELTGTLKDYLGYASDCLKNAHIDFETTAFPTVEDALAAMERGEIDCVFPANLSGYDGEVLNLVMTPPLMRTQMLAVVRAKEEEIFDEKDHVIVAVNKGNTNYESFLLDNFPDWRTVYYRDTSECLKAVSDGVADCLLISSYRLNNIARECAKYNLTTIDTGVDLDYCFAVKNGQRQLYSIFSKILEIVPSSVVNASLSYYSTEDAKVSIQDYILDHLGIVIALAVAILLIILILMIRSMQSERKAQRLIAATEIDDLTGLYNRNYFLAYANRLYRSHPDKPMDAIVLNLEQFHSVNALNGREFGDHILRTLGKEAQTIAMENHGIAGRFGADRFDIYCRHIEDSEGYQAIFDRLQGKLDEESQNANVRLRMGVMEWQSGVEPVQMFDRARVACNMARGHYNRHMIVFDDKIRECEIFEQRLLNDLQRALDGYEFEVHYQPKYDIQCEPPKLVSAEALVRWRHPELGMISPDDFIPLLERSGMIGEVDRFVWSEAARQIVRWRDMYGVTIPVSVNLSRVDVFDPALEETLDGILSYHGIDHDAFRLEVTETAYTENADQVIKVIEELRGKGYIVEMDDFGTGYSSLNMLSNMPVDVLKMDRAFVTNIEHEKKDSQLVTLILDIAKMLDLSVIAEGVETESQLQMLRNLGCDVVQGYYFSKPLLPSEFEEKIIQKQIKQTQNKR